MPLGRNKTQFILLWIAAAIWLPLLVSLWSKLIPLGDMSPGMHTRWDIYLLGIFSGLGIVFAALGQYALLVGRSSRPWLWIIGGAAAYVLENALRYGLFELAMALPNPIKDLLYYALPILAGGLAMAFTQAFVMHAWRLNGMSWFVFSFAAFMAGFCLLIIVDGIVVGLLPQPSESRSLVQGVLKMLALWGAFGALTGWQMWRRLSGEQRSALAPT
jgi:hypothetical protein